MKSFGAFTACLITVCALAFSVSAQTSPVAYVYVSSSPTSGHYEINAYAASSTGRLTRISGSPFPADVQYMALTNQWLFGTNGINIDTFKIESSGAVQQVSTINAQKYNVYQDGGPTSLFLDHTGSSLYTGDTYAYGTGDNAYQTFSVDHTTGQLNFIALGPNGGPEQGTPLSFTGTNVFAYSAGCYKGSTSIYGYKRTTNGSLTALNINPTIPKAANGDYYCSFLAAADPTNHVAISMTPMNFYSIVGPPQLAVYTQTSTGNLTTTSTASNMPKTSVTYVNDLSMAPSGKLLAVAGGGGLQVFHFNGANPITHFTGLLTSSSIDQAFWDNANHLYAISRAAGKLFVFTVTTTGYSQAAGSPYPITKPQNIAVLPK